MAVKPVPSPLQSAFARLNDPGRWPIVALAFTLALSVMSNGLYDALREAAGMGVALLASASLALLIFCAVAWLIVRARRNTVVIDWIAPARESRGLLVVVAKGGPAAEVLHSAAAAAIRHHLRGEHGERSKPTLEHLWLVCTRDVTREGTALADAFGADLPGRIYLLDIAEPHAPIETFEAAEGAFRRARRLGLDAHEVVVDVTGGTKGMALGLAMAAARYRYPIEIMVPREVDDVGRPVPSAGSEARFVDVHFFGVEDN